MVITSGTLPSLSGRYASSFGRDVQSFSTSITANWSWYNKMQGIVSWNLKNNSIFQETAVLYRSGYYFGGAYWPIYIGSGMTSWVTQLAPLMNRGIDKNIMPLGVVDFGNEQRTVAFLFTLDPGQAFGFLEGGFGSTSPPANGILYGTSLEKTGTFCIGYDPIQVADWNKQTSSSQRGYSPNPSNISTVEVSISSFAHYVQLFPKDSITDSKCRNQSEKVIESENQSSSGDIEDIVANIIKKIKSF